MRASLQWIPWQIFVLLFNPLLAVRSEISADVEISPQMKIVSSQGAVESSSPSTETQNGQGSVDASKCLIFGPGLYPHKIVLPARYFFIQLVNSEGQNITSLSGSEADLLKVRIDCSGERQVWTQVLNRHDGSFIVRYKTYQSCLSGFRILVTYRAKHLGGSPYQISHPVHPDNCNCPNVESAQWLRGVRCKTGLSQIRNDLKPFASVDFKSVLEEALRRFFQPGSHSFCHYAVKDNEIYRRCYGQHVGFHIFPDATLLSLARKAYLPDMEFLINLGDWPLVDSGSSEPVIPIFSWCKTAKNADILLPTYEITEASLEGMGRVSLDVMTAMSNSEISWDYKIPKAFWRGRDSRQERLDLILLARKYPDLINASLTNFFFFRDQMDLYGPKADHVSFFKFFNFKYQLNVDGTVAAYRFPFLLAGDSVVLKTDSPYFEYFYQDVQPWTHYVPVKGDLSDLIDQITWLKQHDEEAKRIGLNGRKFVEENLMPLDILCYHVEAFNEWAQRLKNPVVIGSDMELVKQPDLPRGVTCDCTPSPRHPTLDESDKDEL